VSSQQFWLTARSRIPAALCLLLLLTESEVSMGELLIELWSFMKERKKFWLLPIIVCLLMLGSLIVLTSGSAVAPFIYTLF
jgi:Family of unknown function (DUF5989)